MVEEGRNAEAKLEFEKALEHCPGYDDIFWERITLAATERNHNDARDWLKKAVVQCGMPIDEPTLRRFEVLQPFLDSPQYQQLLTWQQERGK